MASMDWSRRQFIGRQTPGSSQPTLENPVSSDDLGLPPDVLLACASTALGHGEIAGVPSRQRHPDAEALLAKFGLRWGQVLDIIDTRNVLAKPVVLASVISVEIHPQAHLPLVVPMEGGGEVVETFRRLVTEKTQQLWKLTVEERIAQIEVERASQIVKDQEMRTIRRRYILAGGSIFFAALSFVGAGPIVERWLKSQDEDPITALNRHVSERGPRQVAAVLAVDRAIQKDPAQARTFLSELTPGHYVALARYAGSGEISQPDALLLVKVMHRLAQLELSVGRAPDDEAGARAAFKRSFILIFRDSPYREVRYEVADLLKSL